LTRPSAGHVFCSFLALVLKAELEARIAAPGQNIEDVPPDELKRRAWQAMESAAPIAMMCTILTR
jgi:hypothetical protein